MRVIGTMMVGHGAVTLAERPPAPPERWEMTPPWFSPPASEQFEVLFVAAGRQAVRYARALQQHPCCRPDPGSSFGGARVVSLEPDRSSIMSDSDSARTRARLHEHMTAGLLVILVVSEDGPWDAAFAGSDPLLRDIPDAKLLAVDLRHDDSRARRCIARGLAVGRPGAGAELGHNTQLDSVPAAILYALFQSGFVCIDYAHYLHVHDAGPALAVAGFGRALRGERVSDALDRAYADWCRQSREPGTIPGATMLVVGDPLEDVTSVHRLEWTVESFLADRAPDGDHRRFIALPILPPGSSEVAFITWHRPIAG